MYDAQVYNDWQSRVLATQTDERSVRLFIPCAKQDHADKALGALKTVAHDFAMDNCTAKCVSVSEPVPVQYDGHMRHTGYMCMVIEETPTVLEIIPPNRKLN